MVYTPGTVLFDMQANLMQTSLATFSNAQGSATTTINNIDDSYYKVTVANGLGATTPYTTYPVFKNQFIGNWATEASINYNYIYNYATTAAAPTNAVYYFHGLDLAGVDGSDYSVYAFEAPEQREKRLAEELASEVKRQSANKRAEDLLMMLLNDKQKKEYIELGYFETQINDRVYRIRKGRSGNIRMLKDGKEKEKFCVHPVDYLPDPDTMIAQYLMLKTDEKAFLAKANRTVLY